jgi:hypothetical protein
MGKYDFKKVAANHCTGIPAVKKMVELGYPVVKGTGRFGSKSDLVVGNGCGPTRQWSGTGLTSRLLKVCVKGSAPMAT